MSEVIKSLRPKRYIAAGKTQWILKQLSNIHAVAYTDDRPDLNSYTATVFVRRALKPVFAYRFKTAEQRNEYVEKWVAGQVKREEDKANSRKQRTSGHSLKVGDVINTSWGYDQTNVEYFQVVGLKGKATVKLREIASVEHDDSHVLPAVDHFIGKVFEKRVNGEYNSVKISDCRRATPVSKDADGNYKPSYRTPWGMGH